MSGARDIQRTSLRRAAGVTALVWTGVVLAYAAGYVGTLAPEGGALALAILGFAAAIGVPVAGLFGLSRLAEEVSAREARIEALETRLRKAERTVEAQEKRLAAAEAALRRPEPAPAPARPEPAPAVAPAPASPLEPEIPAQGSLALEGGADAGGPVALPDMIRALNFPRDANDTDGFAVLRRALSDQELARLLQASEDCLNMMAQEGLYMDDLFPAPASADDWRQFAKGGAARAALMPLNGITDTKALETVKGRMRADPIFRDTALYFQRRFDHLLQRIAPEADDGSLLRFVDTRSGRAFVLLVQAGGIRDSAPKA
ncbi:hypothetical protein HMH01_04145 [Halovulum dunhuangense]|uniref:Uncharacterized protein n=1 Tax=Halovulum dunhuangense TaxID=1505036 RepID=A0A849KWJ2_9RHOB|nr:hypothetical protein [Halovulum dunhuangense]NNU79625.1 hypothetical protein [Halovulum dunhuangense]